MEFLDSHAHYDDEKFDIDRKFLIKEMYDSGITKIISAGYNIKSSKDSLKISEKYEHIYSTCGISPNDIPNTETELYEQLDIIRKISKNKKVVAIGEIGLDYYWNKENKKMQEIAFIEQIKIANNLNLPIVIHLREAIQDLLNILKNNENSIKLGVFHCCTLNRELVKEALKLGYYISFAGPITFKNSKNANEIIEMVPLDKMLIETDSPYLSPEPNRGKINNSLNLKYIAEKISSAKNISIEEVANNTYQNAEKLFNI